MAQDDNGPPRVRGTPPGATDETFPGSKSQADGATEESKKPAGATLEEAFKSIKADDFLHVHEMPCTRQSLMTGIGSGAAVGVGKYILGRPVPKASNWAFGVFFISSILQYEYCHWQRRTERAAVARAVEVMDKKQAEKKAQAQEAARLKQEAQEREKQEAAAKRSWYKFW
ncbi:hypothetical protein F5Y04DRAFT_45717 [Hypomontagnella monticulosa]|nr:hypothetical protein F5Y04DRAFT_45717 [Hypomontagnella monticulosa]